MNIGIDELSSTALTAVCCAAQVHQALEHGDAGQREQQQDAGAVAQQRQLAAQRGQGERCQRQRAPPSSARNSATPARRRRAARGPANPVAGPEQVGEREQEECHESAMGPWSV
jgi:hypothetical protein